MKKELKDYLHLYLGCVGFGSSGCSICLTAESLTLILKGEVKFTPILRPLSDITEEEKSTYCMIYYDEQFETEEQKIFTHAKATKFLLSKHFDLFGLIEAGLAINKTTLNQEA